MTGGLDNKKSIQCAPSKKHLLNMHMSMYDLQHARLVSGVALMLSSDYLRCSLDAKRGP